MQRISIGHKVPSGSKSTSYFIDDKEFSFPSVRRHTQILAVIMLNNLQDGKRHTHIRVFHGRIVVDPCRITYPVGVIAPLSCDRDMQCIIYFRRTRYMSLFNELPGNQHNTMQIHPKDNCMSRECRKAFIRAKHQQLSRMHGNLSVISTIITHFPIVI